MADYYPVLKRAISSLPSSSGDARRIVYEKARAALLKQLQSYDPPLSPADVTEQRLALEECIRRIESEVAGVAYGMAAEPEAETTPPAHAPAGVAAAERLRAADRREDERPAARREDERPAAGHEPRPPGGPGVEGERVPPRHEQETLAPPVATVQKPLPPAQPRREAPPPPPPEPVRSEPRIGAGISALSTTLRQADHLGEASAQALRSARDAIEDEAPPPARDDKIEPSFLDTPIGTGRAESGWPEPEAAPPAIARAPADRSSGRAGKAERQSARAPASERRRSRAVPVGIAIVLLAVVFSAAAVYTQRERIMALWSPPASAPVEDPVVDAVAPPADDGLEPKIVDRLPQEGGDTPVAPDARTVQTVDIAPDGEVDFPPADGSADEGAPPDTDVAAAPPVDATPPAAEPSPAAPADGGQAVLVQQRAILYEEPIPGSDGARVDGRVIWSLVNEPVLPGEPPVTQVRAVVEVPARGITLTMSFRRNADEALPASHVVEARFDVPADFPGRAIDTTPGLIMKQTEDARGDALVGAVAKVADNLFWLALSGGEQESAKNLALLAERQWIDVPIRYANRRRAILTFEKGAPGERVMADALAAWRG